MVVIAASRAVDGEILVTDVANIGCLSDVTQRVRRLIGRTANAVVPMGTSGA